MNLKGVALTLFGLILSAFGAIQPTKNCDYYQEILPGQTFDVYSPDYNKGKYPAGITCRWRAVAPARSTIVLKCNEFSIPQSANCVDDRLSISPTGNMDVTDGHLYCGTGTFSVTSENNGLVMVLISPYYSGGGKFKCSVTATATPTTPPPSSCDCGWKKETRIVNGQETGVNEFPMMAGIVDLKDGTGLFCGGTIVSKRYCVTAAHCLINRKPNATAVLVGDHDISTGVETNTAKLIEVQKFIPHENYNTATQANDIALLRLTQDIVFRLEVGPACLPFRFKQKPSIGDIVEALGWGTTEQAGPKSDTLMKTSLYVVNLDQCKEKFGSKINANQVCTYNNGTDACQSDSGGPLLWEGTNNRIHLTGIISYGKGCATKYPGVNTRITSYIDWILDNSPDADYCIR